MQIAVIISLEPKTAKILNSSSKGLIIISKSKKIFSKELNRNFPLHRTIHNRVFLVYNVTSGEEMHVIFPMIEKKTKFTIPSDKEFIDVTI